MREFTQMRNLLIADSVALHLDVKVVVVSMSVKYIVGSNECECIPSYFML